MKESYCDITTVSEQEWEHWYHAMSSERQKKCKRLTDELAKKQCIAADRLAKTALGEAMNCSPDKILIRVSPSGKPYAEGNPMYFSISHSEHLVACAVDLRPIGIDLEKIRPIKETVQERICTENEKAYLRTAKDKQERLLRFFTLWTRKEAFFKARGTLPRTDRETEVLTDTEDVVFRTRAENGYVISTAEKMS